VVLKRNCEKKRAARFGTKAREQKKRERDREGTGELKKNRNPKGKRKAPQKGAQTQEERKGDCRKIEGKRRNNENDWVQQTM